MPDLKTQLVDYFDHVVERVDVAAIIVERGTERGADEVTAQARDTAAQVMRSGSFDDAEANVCETCGSDLTVFDLREPAESPVPAPRKRRAAVLAVAAAILVVAGVVVVADQTDDNLVTEPATSATTPDAVPSPTPPDPTPPPAEAGPPPSVVDSLGYRWSRVPHSEAVFGGAAMSSVTVGGPGLVAVGSAGSDAAVWISADGVTWSRVPHDEATFGGEGGRTWMSDVIAGGPGLVAVGISGFDRCCGLARIDSVVWTSVDGLTWSRVPHDEAVFGGALMSSVTAGGPGLVAVGVVDSGGDPDELDGDAAVWTSVDGVTWSRVPHDEAVFGGADNQQMLDVTVGGPGLVAVGVDGQNVWDYSLGQVAAVWTSVDGVTWSRVSHDDAVFGEKDGSEDWAGQVMFGVTSGGPGLVAVGADISPLSGVWTWGVAVWTSVDGVTWSRSPYDGEPLGLDELTGWRGVFMRSVTDGGPGLVAVGSDVQDDEDSLVWTSVDGITWSRVPYDEAVFGGADNQQMLDVTVGGPGLVVVGSAGDDAAVRVATPEN